MHTPASTTVLTGVVGSRCSLRDDQNTAEAQFVAFSDRALMSSTWRIIPALRRFQSPHRNAITPKLLTHTFVDTEFSVWLDDNVALRISALELIAKVMLDCDIAVFSSRRRDCVYEEAVALAVDGAADPSVLAEHMERYRRSGIPEHAGLPATPLVVRRHSPSVERFNCIWFAEFCRYSAHDQLSFMFATRESGVKVKFIPRNPETDSYVDITRRHGFREPYITPPGSAHR